MENGTQEKHSVCNWWTFKCNRCSHLIHLFLVQDWWGFFPVEPTSRKQVKLDPDCSTMWTGNGPLWKEWGMKKPQQCWKIGARFSPAVSSLSLQHTQHGLMLPLYENTMRIPHGSPWSMPNNTQHTPHLLNLKNAEKCSSQLYRNTKQDIVEKNSPGVLLSGLPGVNIFHAKHPRSFPAT